MRKILVLRGGALGDFIVTLPALALLRRRWPAAEIHLVGNPTAAALGVAAGLLDTIHSQHESRWSALYTSAPLLPPFATELATFDLVLSFWPDPDQTLARHFRNLSDPIFLTSSACPSIAPAAAHYCDPLRALSLASASFHYTLSAPDPSAHFIAIHPGSGSAKKNWPLPRWVELSRWLRDSIHAELLIITGEADITAASALEPFGTPAHQLPLSALVTRLTSCRLFVGHDSGISHLAAACRVPSLLLFGPTDPYLWAPPAPRVTVLRRGPSLDAISLGDVQSALRPLLVARTQIATASPPKSAPHSPLPPAE
jgi:heptosyltransferase-3